MIEQLVEAFHVGKPHVASAALHRIFLLRDHHVREAVGEGMDALAEDIRRFRVDREAEDVLWCIRRRKFHFEEAVVLELMKL